MNRIIIDSIAVLTAVLLLIFSAFAFQYKKGRILNHKILSAFLFANALYIIDFSLSAIQDSTGLNLQWFKGIGSSFGFLFGPLLYLYSKSITQKEFSIRASESIHFIIFVIVLSAVFLNIKIPALYKYGALYLQTIPYMVACFILIIDYRKRIKDFYSTVGTLNLTWMLYVVGAFFIMWIVDLLDFALAVFKIIGPTGKSYLVFISLLINFIFVVLIFYKALQHPEIFMGISEEERNRKYRQSRLTETERYEYLQKLEKYFLAEKPFLNPELTINDVSRSLNISSKYISQVINESLQKNFYDFINTYRIEEAKNMLKDENGSKKTVLEILYESGFNSKSTFNTAFKKHTGFTPTQYRKQYPVG